MIKGQVCFISGKKSVGYLLLFSCISLLLSPWQSNAQPQSEKGLPFITNYLAKTYKALPQTWCIQEDDRGIMYFGIQNYILEYDGVKWRKIIFPGQNVVRSLTKNKDGIIYYGGFGDIGYLDYDSLGQKKVTSLLNLVPANNRAFLDIWSAYATETNVYFQSREYIFRLDDKKPGAKAYNMMKVWKPKTKFMYAFYLDGNYYVHQQGLGLYKMENDSLVLVPGSEFLGKERMQVMLPYKTASNQKQYIIGLFYSGLYLFDGKMFQPYPTKADPIIKSGSLLYKGIQLKNGNYVLSTTGKGLVIIDAQGNLLQKINRDVGLQDESVYGTYEDKKGSLWLALDNGISRVETASPLTKFALQSGINTGVLSITRFEDNLYLGTTNGLLAFNNTTSFFEPIPGVPQNQIFTLLPDGKQLLVPGDGLFAVKNKKASTIQQSVSADLTLSGLYISKKHPDILFGGGTFGAAFFNKTSSNKLLKEPGQWHFGGYIPGITDQIWSFAENKDGTIWAGTQAGLAYRITPFFDEKGNIDVQKTTFKKYGPEHGYKNGLGAVYSIRGNNYFIADSSLFIFDDKINRFVADSSFGHFKNGGGNNEFDMAEDNQGRVWIRFGKELRIATPKPEGGYRIDNTLLNSINELTIQKIFAEKNGIVWICTTDGLIRYDENIEKNNDQIFKTVLRFASAGKNPLSTIINPGTKPAAVSYNNNSLRFEYAAPFFEQEEKTQYQTWLEGFEKDWSDFDNNYYKEYTNLPAGNYHFHVRAKNIYQKLSDEAVYHFSITPPWYRTWWAYLLYALAALTTVYFIIKWRTQQLHQQHRELEKIVADRTVQLSQRVEELAVINSVQEGLVREMDMQGIYELVGEKIREIFNAQVIDIVTYNKSANQIEDRYAFEKGDRTLLKPRPPKGFRKHVIDTGELIMVNENVEKAAFEFDNELLIGEMPKSMVLVPMIVGGEVKGIISLQHMDRENAFNESDVNLLTTLANSMSVALESARRFDETNRLLKETEQRTAELAVINSVQEGLAKELDMQGIYDLVGDRIQELFSAQVVIIASFDLDNKMEYFNYRFEEGKKNKTEPRPLGKLRLHLIETRKKVVINNQEESYEWFGKVTVPGTKPLISGVFVPLIIGDKITSYVSLQNIDRENAFSEPDIRLLETLANSMSVALENARLFDETNRLLKETEQRTAELAVINSVQDGLAKELDMQGIYNLVGDRLCELFPDTQTLVIRTFDHNTGFEHWQYAMEKGVRQNVAPRPLNWNSKQLILTKKPLDIKENYVEISKKHGGIGVTAGQPPKSAVFVPMLSGDVTRGSISLQNVDKENAFTDSDLRLLTTITNSMSVALENARLFDETTRLLKETEQRTAELAIINSVQEGLAKELKMQGIYDLVGEKIREIFSAQVIDIVTYDAGKNLIEDQYAFEKGDRTLIGVREPKGFRKHVIQTGQLLLHNTNVEQATRDFNNPVLIGEMPKSQVFVPMIAGGEVKGIISLQNLDNENAFSHSDTSLLTTLSNSMSVALESARLFDETTRLLKETEQRTAELSVINSVQEGLSKELDIRGIYELVGEKMREVFNAQVIDIVTYDKTTDLIEDRYTYEKGDRTLLGSRPLKGFRKHVIETGQQLVINSEMEKRMLDLDNVVMIGAPSKSVVFVPMIASGEVTGVISLQNIDQENAFSPSDVRLLTTLGNSMSVALESARLFDETNRLLGEAKQRATELGTVNNISKALASQLDADDLIKLVGDQLKDLFSANIVYLALLNQKTNIIYFPYQVGDTLVPMKLGEGLTSKIILNGEPLLINKDLQELRAQMGIQKIGVPAASYLGVPIPVGDENIGVLSVQSTEQENRFNENDLRLLSTIASSVGVALRNATLFEEVKLAKREAESASKLAEKANEAKSAFLSTVSHELRTPLTSVLGFAKIIKKRLEEKIFPIVDKSDAKTDKTVNQISENLQVVISEGERLTHLINDVLDLAKIEAGKMDFNQENVSMPEVAERAIAATTALFDQKALKLIRKIDTGVPEITGDKDKLIQVIINLISNSVKFTDEGSITCSVYQQKDELIVSIADTGIGIDAADFGAVFEQFKQVGGDTLTDKPKGTGLGLPICKEIVEHLGGRIWLESEKGKGSTFSFALPINKKTAGRPVHLEDLVRQLKEQVAHSQLNLAGQAAKILIVDDDDSIRSLLHQELGDGGYEIDEARNGKEALQKVRMNRPNLIILDIMMPEMNGFDVAAVLKNDPETMDIPIIVLSVVQDKARGFRIGVDRYLTKPIDTGLLFAEIGTLLEQGKSKKKVMIVDEDSGAVNSLIEVLAAKGYEVMESTEKELMEKATANLPDIIIINSVLSGRQDIVKTLRFEKGLENVLFVVYQ